MKIVLMLLSALAALAANAQPTNSTPPLESQMINRLSKASSLLPKEAKPNEIVKARVTYSGVAVELLKAGNPLQLVNPAAPAKYRSPEDNVMRDPISGRVSGWKIFSIGF